MDEKINRGVCSARNLAIAAAKGEYILPLDGDDKIGSEYVEKALKVLQNNPQIGIVYCKAAFFGTVNKRWRPKKFDRNKIPFSNQIFNTSMFRKKDFEDVGGYKECMKYGCEDWELWLSLVEKGFEAYMINEVLFYYRMIHSETRSNSAVRYTDLILSEIFKNHINLYLNNEEFYRRVFRDFERKYKKYRILFHLLLAFAIVQTLVLLFIVLKIL